jgi:hypothetical protein
MKLGLVRRVAVLLFTAWVFFCAPTYSQTTSATITGQITDQSGRLVPGAAVVFTNINTGVPYMTQTNAEGIYSLPTLQPGIYRANVTKDGFKSIVKPDIELHVQDQVSINFALQLGSVSETITVEAGTPLVDTQDATVSTVVDRQFAENLPMNGRSFQTLIELAPGVVVTPSNSYDSGQFSVNGQRGSSNYWMVDGVGANIGIGSANGASAGEGLSGAAASFSVLGGTNSLVSVDAMQEFRIQTSTYAPEFGRTPGAQISIVTRSGTNQFHGTAFDYFRNDALDANNWFNDFAIPALPKAKEQQNDFGGTLSGPIVKDGTFFFFSYEGLRLRLPQTTLSDVPCDDTCQVSGNVRAMAVPAMQPFVNAFPLPNGPDLGNGLAEFNASYSDPASLDAYSIRIDHKLSDTLTLFGRYNYSPSELTQRGNGFSLNTVFPSRITVQTATAGATWLISPVATDDLRFNYSRTNNNSFSYLDGFGGAVPLASSPFPGPFTSQNGLLFLDIFGLGSYELGPTGHNLQRQINVVDNLSVQRGAHSLKFGVDFRRLSPTFGNSAYYQEGLFLNVSAFAAGNVFLHFVTSSQNSVPFLFHNLGVFAQDSWRVTPRLTMTYGLRWDVDFAPSSSPSLLAVTGFNLSDLSSLALAPAGTPPFKTTYGNVAPRLGVAYQLRQSQEWQTVLRGGLGVFYDLATSEVGNALSRFYYPFGATTSGVGGSFPLSSTDAAPPPITSASLPSGALYALDPNLKLPYTLEWNVSLEQALGSQQTISASYIGSVGRRLIQSADITSPNPNFGAAYLVTNAATSDYEALQLQFQRRLSAHLQALGSYTWSHSIDTASAGSLYGNESNGLVPSLNPNQNRGPSDFDIRNAFSVAMTYDLPTPKINAFTNAILRGWSVENVVQARSALPVTIYDGSIFNFSSGSAALIRPDVVPGQPLYLYGAECASVFQSLGELVSGQTCPGGKGFNPNAFTPPPTDSNGNALEQGNLPRNALRGFGVAQWDFAVHREFPIHDTLRLQFRAEMFNVLNHPNFAPPIADISNTSQFGLSTETLGQYLAGGNVGNGGFSSLYQVGGPRSIQLALKLLF